MCTTSRSKCYRFLYIIGSFFLLTIITGCQGTDLSADIFHSDRTLKSTIDNTENIQPITSESTFRDNTRAEKFGIINSDFVYGAIISTDFSEVKKVLETIKDPESYQTVVLLAPTDHQTEINSVFTYENSGPLSEFQIKIDQDTVKKLTDNNHVQSLGTINVNSFWNNPSLSAFSKQFKDAKFILISINKKIPSHEADTFAYVLKSSLPENSIVIALTDFNKEDENLNPLIKEFQQDYTYEILNSADISHFDELPLDSSITLEVLGNYLRRHQAKSPTLLKSSENGYQIAFRKGNTEQGYSTTYLVAFGDIMLGRYVRTLMDANGLDYTLKNMDESYLKVNDILLANLEGPITTKAVRTMTGMNFGFFPDTAPLLKKYHFDILSQANNHAFDKRKDAYDESFKYLQEQGIIAFGNPNEIVEESVGYMHVRGQRFAFFGLEEVNTGIDDEQAVQKVKDLAAEGYKVIVFPHWGYEYNHKPSKRQKELGHKLIDAGAYMIIGHHPHVVQTIENYNGHPIVYSLGNAIFDQYWSAPTQEGLSIALKLSENHIEIYLLPIKLPASQFRLMTPAENAEFINRFITWADYTEEEKQQILAGKMTFNF